MLDLIAEAGLGAEHGMTGWMVVLALVTLTSLGGNVVAFVRGGKREVSITDKPLRMEMEEQFVTRREFDSYRADMAKFEAKIEGFFERVFDRIDERDIKLSEQIEKVATGAYEGRQRIHETLNRTRERIAKVEIETKNCPRPGQKADACKP